MAERTIKNYGDTWLYFQGNYEKNLHEFLVHSKVIDKKDESFDNIKYEVKRRQIHNSIVKVLENENVILLVGDLELPKTFKVFVAKDVKGGTTKKKVYIDCTNLLVNDTGDYELPIRNVDIFISYLLSAMTCLIYYTDPNKLFNNANIIESSNEAFSKLFFYVIDYLRIGNVEKVKEKTLYLASQYYQTCLLDKAGESATRRALKISGLNSREADVLEIQVPEKSYENINTFITTLASVLKANVNPEKSLTTDVFIAKWGYLLGTNTIFGLELFPAFSNILTNVYVAAYLNNQKTIEKICGRSVDNYTNQLLNIGSGLMK